MFRSFAAAIVVALVSCGSEPPPESEGPFDSGLLGRWDVTVQGEDSYPLWFEVEETGGRLAGRIQGRFGHALPMEDVQAMGAHLMWNVEGTSYHSNLEEERIRGGLTTAEGENREWIAVRAPLLAAPVDPEWGEPIELFNGVDLAGWRPRLAETSNFWHAEDGVLVNDDAGTDLVTESSFEDFRLHIEVQVPAGSNSGIYLRGRYEVQVQDDHGKEPHARHMGGIYGQITPTANAALPAGEWQAFDITLLGRWVTVVLNGETVIDNQEIPGITGGALDSKESEPGPIFLQGDHGRVLYRNIVLTPAL
ncbi:MAG TPA: DUF1080 domain-containing protein [Vicinamibacteria bacterium]|nr:DUF1080 domain-containing protein [Vicinamibacteria bacterium]